MVAIKQVANSALPDIRKDEPAAVSRPAMLRGDNAQAVKSVQQEVQKKMTELLAKAKQRKKQAEEQLAPAQFSPVITTSSMPLNKQLALPHITPQPKQVSIPSTLAQGHEVAEQPKVMAERRAKPVPVADKASGVVVTEVLTKLTETLTQSQAITRDNNEQPLPGLISATRDKPEMPMASVSSSRGRSEEKSDTSFSQDMTDRSHSAVEQPVVVSSESVRESTPSFPLAEKKESTLGDDQIQLLATQQLSTQPLVTPASTVTQPEEVKTMPQAEVPERAESEPTAGRRTLSYTFSQWKNSPTVKFELSNAGELTALTNSVEVQQALQDNHHLLASENPLHFGEERRDEEHERRGQHQSEQEDET